MDIAELVYSIEEGEAYITMMLASTTQTMLSYMATQEHIQQTIRLCRENRSIYLYLLEHLHYLAHAITDPKYLNRWDIPIAIYCYILWTAKKELTPEAEKLQSMLESMRDRTFPTVNLFSAPQLVRYLLEDTEKKLQEKPFSGILGTWEMEGIEERAFRASMLQTDGSWYWMSPIRENGRIRAWGLQSGEGSVIPHRYEVELSEEDALFISHAKRDVLRLLGEVKRLRKKLEENGLC